jgi:signal peptidase
VTAAIVVLSLSVLVVRYVGLTSYVVMGGSSEPNVPIGSLVLVAPVPANAVRVGELVTVTLPEQTLTHRVVAIEQSDGGEFFTLRDDATPSPDPVRVQTAPVVGRPWVAIPALGYAVNYAQAYALPITLGLIVWILFVFAVRALTPYMSTERRRLAA